MEDDKKILVNLLTTKEELKSLITECLSAIKIEPPEQEIEEELLTIKQIAVFFQVSETTIHAWKNKGVLPYIKVKSRIRFKKSIVLGLYEKRRGQRRLHL